MKAYMKKHDIFGQRIFKTKMREVVFLHKTLILAPPEKVRTKGASKRKKEFDTSLDPSYWEYVDAFQESAKQPSQRSARQSSQLSANQSSQYSARQPFHIHFPIFIHPYIEKIIDVVSDGNCGFCATIALLGWTEESWSLVRSQLDKEIHLHQDLYSNVFYDSVESVRNSLKISGLGAQGKDMWMSIPDLGYVIATLYNVILVSLHRNLNMTFFLLNKAPSKESYLYSLLAIGFVNENHWLQIKLKSHCPLPPTSQN
ncbi:uncharacterized protein [Cicer arietinum]|uniref:Uncharacterized protein LOC101512999 n=1 Tax=Cicer arietinum TaxID=3827 RepID=A0A1S2YU03_CICAR|nr:uncharacterized protein LOC101512999 [Cicer arietinum]